MQTHTPRIIDVDPQSDGDKEKNLICVGDAGGRRERDGLQGKHYRAGLRTWALELD